MNKQIYNPYLPSWEYVPDGEPHVFNDRLYVLGSHDRFGGKDYCENDYVCWSAPVDDLSNWNYEGVILKKEDTPWNTEKKPLYAPDVCQGSDGRYYLYYSVQNSSITSVAVCDTPAGRYRYLGDVHFPDGRVHGSDGSDWFNFDPAVLVDTDGRIWLYSGSGQSSNRKYGHEIMGSFVMELDKDMLTIISEPRVVLPADRNTKKPRFFEGTSVRRIGEWYYLVYAASGSPGLNYAMSPYPDRDFVWKGRLHCTGDVNYRGIGLRDAHYPLGNNHGGLVSIKGQWYIFNHRLTNGDMIGIGRQGVAEPVTIREDGTFDMVEATSCGLNQGPLSGTGIYPAYICCNLYRYKSLLRLPPFGKVAGGWVTQDGPDYDPPEPTDEHSVNSSSEINAPQAYVHVTRKGTIIGYKYFNLDENIHFELKIRGSARGTIEVASAPCAAPAARLKIVPSGEWKIVSADFSAEFLEKSAKAAGADFTAKRMPIFLRVNCRGAVDILEFKLA